MGELESKGTSRAYVAIIHVGGDEGLDKAADTLEMADMEK